MIAQRWAIKLGFFSLSEVNPLSLHLDGVLDHLGCILGFGQVVPYDDLHGEVYLSDAGDRLIRLSEEEFQPADDGCYDLW